MSDSPQGEGESIPLPPGPSALAVLHNTAANSGCHAWRIWQPYRRLRERRYRAVWTSLDDPMLDEHSATYQIVVMPKLAFEPENRAIGMLWRNHLHGQGIPMVYECDDDHFSDAAADRAVRLFGQPPDVAERIRDANRWTLDLADGVTVSTPHLAEVVRLHTDKPVEVVPNAIDSDWFRAARAQGKRTVKGLTVGWQGGARLETDLAPMATAWGKLARRYRQVRFVVQGWRPQVIARAVPADRLTILPWLEVARYPEGLVNVDIGCCPLADNPFNRCKSPIKALEWAVNGSAVVASPLLYGEVIRHGEDGYIARTADEWEGYLSRLIESRERRDGFAKRLGERVERRYSLKANLGNWPSAYQRIRDRVSI